LSPWSLESAVLTNANIDYQCVVSYIDSPFWLMLYHSHAHTKAACAMYPL
jgi:hypothetical protein